MLMNMAELLEQGVKPGPTVHVGAHTGEEATVYAAYGFVPVFWIEANADVFDELARNTARYEDHHLVCALVSDRVKDVTFHLASNGQSSSYMELGTHATSHPEVTYVSEREMTTTTLDILLSERRIGRASYLSMDVQGTELDVLRGGEQFLTTVDSIYAEVNENEVYVGNALFDEVTAWLAARGFTLRAVKMTPYRWGDALFTR